MFIQQISTIVLDALALSLDELLREIGLGNQVSLHDCASISRARR